MSACASSRSPRSISTLPSTLLASSSARSSPTFVGRAAHSPERGRATPRAVVDRGLLLHRGTDSPWLCLGCRRPPGRSPGPRRLGLAIVRSRLRCPPCPRHRRVPRPVPQSDPDVRDRPLEPTLPLRVTVALAPEAPDSARQARGALALIGGLEVVEGRPDVVLLAFEEVEPVQRCDVLLRLGFLGEGEHMRAACRSSEVTRHAGGLPRALERVLAASRASSSARRSGGAGSCRRATGACRGRRRTTSSAASSVQPPAKTERRAKRRCSSGVEQVVAPLDRRTERALTLGQVARPAGQQRRRCSSRARICAGRAP